MTQSIFDLAEKSASNPALFFGPRVITYGELHERVRALSSWLLGGPNHKGDRVGLWSENSPFSVAAYLGIIRAGLVAVPFQIDANAEDFARIVQHAGIRLVLASRRFAPRLAASAGNFGIQLVGEGELEKFVSGGTQNLPEIEPSRDYAALMFTSGSTGSPKGVMVTHRNIECNTRDIIEYLGLTSADRVMVVLPFHYCYGLSLLHTHLAAGGSLVLNNQFVYPEEVLNELAGRECTGLAGVPSTYQILLRQSRFKHMSFPALRWLQQAGGKLPNPLIREIVSAFPLVKFYVMYGQTEATARLSYLPPEHLGDKLGSIGRGLRSTKLEVLRSDGAPVSPGTEEIGEIVASGENITSGYWGDPAETARYFRNGKLHTGDLAKVDQDGFIYIVERERDMIKSRGNRVSAKEVEDVIAEIPEVVEVGVTGVPHELIGEAIRAFIVTTDSAELTPDFVRDYCRQRLSSYKVPEDVRFIKNMPHNSSGKISKAKLREMR